MTPMTNAAPLTKPQAKAKAPMTSSINADTQLRYWGFKQL
jgi:hypothetical protein